VADISLTGMSPASGPATGGTRVQLLGQFTTGLNVTVAFTPANGGTATVASVASYDASVLNVTVPALGAGNYSVSVSLNGQQYTTATGLFQAYGALGFPVVCSVRPVLTRRVCRRGVPDRLHAQCGAHCGRHAGQRERVGPGGDA
jgi:hypothetical protein